MDEVDALHKGFDDIDLLLGRNNKQLQVELFEKAQGIAGTLVTPPPKCFVDHHKTKRTAFDLRILQAKLKSQ